MSTNILNAPTPEERSRVRDIDMKRQRDERERRMSDQVTRIEQEVRALRLILEESGKERDNETV